MFHLNFTLSPHFYCIFSRKKQRHFCRCFKSCICRFMSKLCSYFFISKLYSRQEYHEQDQIHRELDKIFRYSRCAVCEKTARTKSQAWRRMAAMPLALTYSTSFGFRRNLLRNADRDNLLNRSPKSYCACFSTLAAQPKSSLANKSPSTARP